MVPYYGELPNSPLHITIGKHYIVYAIVYFGVGGYIGHLRQAGPALSSLGYGGLGGYTGNLRLPRCVYYLIVNDITQEYFSKSSFPRLYNSRLFEAVDDRLFDLDWRFRGFLDHKTTENVLGYPELVNGIDGHFNRLLSGEKKDAEVFQVWKKKIDALYQQDPLYQQILNK
jgi:hypothetical protein